MFERLVRFLLGHASELIAAAFWPLLLGALVAGVASTVLIVVALRRRWWRGLPGGVTAAVLGLLALPSAAGVGLSLAAGPLAEAGARLVGEQRDALGVSAPLGLALLLPVVDAWTLDGADDDALAALETKDLSIDLAVLCGADAQQKLLQRLTPAHIRGRYERHAKAAVDRATARGPAGRRVAAAIEGELVALRDAYPALLTALHADAAGRLSPETASAQLAGAFFTSWGPQRARRLAEGERGWALLLAVGPWWLAAGVACLVGRLSSRRGPL